MVFQLTVISRNGMIVYSVATQGHAEFEGGGKTNSVPPPSSLFLGHHSVLVNKQKCVFGILIRKLSFLIPEKSIPAWRKRLGEKKRRRVPANLDIVSNGLTPNVTSTLAL
jgi:hypothetical protein